MPNRKMLAITAVMALLVCSSLIAAEETNPSATVSAIKVLPDKAPDCTSLKTIVESVTRGCRTNDEKAIAIYNFMRMTHYHRAYPSEPGGIPVLKEINCYGWSLCGGLHAEQSALWREMGWEWRFVGWPGHTTVEAYYDGGWHYLDVFLKFYAWMPRSAPSRKVPRRWILSYRIRCKERCTYQRGCQRPPIRFEGSQKTVNTMIRRLFRC